MQEKIDHQSGSCVAGKSIFIQTEGVTAWEERFPVMKKFSFRFQVLPALLRLLFPHPQKQPLPSVKSVVCIRPGKLGDMFVATRFFPRSRTTGGETACGYL
jgi:hypothetical protein